MTQELTDFDLDPYSLFLFAMNSPLTKKKAVPRLNKFLEFINLSGTVQDKCSTFVQKSKKEPTWALGSIIKFLQMNKNRVEKNEITAATLSNEVKTIKLFCEMNEILLPWKRITRGLPKGRRYADDRAPTLEEIRKIVEYPDIRIKAIVSIMVSSGIRLGAWNYLKWKHITPVIRDEKIIAAKIIVYQGDPEQYFSFITPEAFFELEKWINHRKQSGEEITEDSWVMRNIWDRNKGSRRKPGIISKPRKLQSQGVKRMMETALWTQGLRCKLEIGKRRHEFQADHGLRKYFKTKCEIAGMMPINIEILMGHSVGISDSYYRATEKELLDDYLKAINFLTIGKEQEHTDKIQSLIIEHSNIESDYSNQLVNKELEIDKLSDQNISNTDAIAALTDQVMSLVKEINLLKEKLQIADNKKI